MNTADPNLRVAECAKAATIACTKALTVDGKVNLPTLLAGIGRMAGRYLLRSLALDLSKLPPGTAVLSPQASQKTPLLTHFCATTVQNLGTALPAAPTVPFDELRAKLNLDFLQTQAALEPVLAPMKTQHQLDDESMAKALAVAAGALVHQFKKHVEPAAGFGYAVYGFTEGMRTAPAPGPGA